MVLVHSAAVSCSGMVISAVASAIDFSTMPNFDDLDQSLVIVYGIDDAIIALSDAYESCPASFSLPEGRGIAARSLIRWMIR